VLLPAKTRQASFLPFYVSGSVLSWKTFCKCAAASARKLQAHCLFEGRFLGGLFCNLCGPNFGTAWRSAPAWQNPGHLQFDVPCPGEVGSLCAKGFFFFAGSLIVPPLAAKMILFMTFSRSVVVSAAGLGLPGWRLRSRLRGFLFALCQQLAALQTHKL
jgi:hypothetical protein